MTRLLEQAIEAIRQLPDERQDELAEVMISVAGTEDQIYTSAQLKSLARARAQAASGNFSSEAEITAFREKYRHLI